MKNYVRIAVLFVVVAVIALISHMLREAAAPESAIIAKEMEKSAASFDKDRAAKDDVYKAAFQDKLRFLDYRLAVALNKENKPDAAIGVLQKLINDEEAESKARTRRSRSYFEEANYYDALESSYSLKQDKIAAEQATERRAQLLARAEHAKRKERSEEGRSIGLSR